MLTEALAAVARDGAVFPLHEPRGSSCTCGRSCGSPGKHPRTPHGVLEATTDVAKIREWWGRFEDANLGLATGEPSGVDVLDVDGAEGVASLAELEAKHGALPRTVEVVTGSGGRHVYFRRREDAPFPSKTRFVPGLDTRGDGGYVVAPPSLHASGRRYAWAPGLSPSEVELAPAPDWLVEAIRAKKLERPVRAPELPRAAAREGWPVAWVRAAVAGVVGDLRDAGEGSRNETLNKAAFRLASLRAGGAPVTDADLEELMQAARDVGLGELEITKTIRSGLRAGGESPASPPLDRTAECLPAVAAEEANVTGSKKRTKLRLTDVGNALRLVELHGKDLHFSEELGWLAWDGQRWRRDTTSEVLRRALDVPRTIFLEAAKLESRATSKQGDEAKKLRKRADALRKHATRSESEPSLRRLVTLARALPSVAVRVEDLDHDPWRLVVKNGTLDLKAGTLMPHRREDLATKLAPVAFDPEALAPLWERFLDRVTGGRAELVGFLQRVAGYSLTGDTSEQCLFLLHGRGQNGKSTFVETLRALLGDYATGAQFSTFLARSEAGVRSDIARLRGARLVSAIESKQAGRFDEGLVKQLTGGDVVVACFKYQNEFEYLPQFKLLLAANEKPSIRGSDLGIWRRVRLVPFSVTIPPEEKDPHFKEKLAGELPGILAWALRGCLAWQRDGLGEPPEVKAATESYRQEEDELGGFVEECCLLAPNASVASRELHRAFCEWSKEPGEKPVSEKRFAAMLLDRGGLEKKHTKSGKRWIGISLRVAGDGLIRHSEEPRTRAHGYRSLRNDGSDPSPATQAVEDAQQLALGGYVESPEEFEH